MCFLQKFFSFTLIVTSNFSKCHLNSQLLKIFERKTIFVVKMQYRGLYHKTFYGSNFCRIVISQSVFQCRSLLPQFNILGQVQASESESSHVRGSILVSSSLACKCLSRLEVTNCGKHSSLLRYGKSYCCKMFYSTGPW